MALHREGRYPEAIQAFRKAIARDERTGESAYNIACGYARLGDRDSALGWLAKASTLGFDLSRFLMDDDDLLSLRADPRFRDLVRRVREESSEGQARSRKAISRFEKMSDDPPTSADPWASVGKELLKAGEYDRAADAFREAAQRAMRPGTSLYNAACALALQGDDEAALVELERAVEGAFEGLGKALDAGFDGKGMLRTDEDLESLRSDPRFRELVRRTELAGHLGAF